jgi:hypothetical protein
MGKFHENCCGYAIKNKFPSYVYCRNDDCVLDRPENGTPRAMEGVKDQLIVD